MPIKTLQNFYKATISQDWATGTGNFYVSTKPVPTSGWLVISSANATLREIIYYSATGTDGTGDYITISTGGRGLGGTTEQTHAIGETIRMNFTAQHQDEIKTAIEAIQTYTPAFIGYNANPNSASALSSANDAVLVAVNVPQAVTVTGIRFACGTSSGNICVGLYDNTGTRLATSGSVASPGTGLRTVNFTAGASINPGIYYLAIAADNNTVTFARFGTEGVIGVNSFASSFPLPTSVTLPGTVSSRAYALVGIVTGGITQ